MVGTCDGRSVHSGVAEKQKTRGQGPNIPFQDILLPSPRVHLIVPWRSNETLNIWDFGGNFGP